MQDSSPKPRSASARRRRARWLAAGALAAAAGVGLAGCQTLSVNRAIREAEAHRPRDPRTGVRVGAEPFEFDAGPPACLLLHGFQASPQVFRELGRRLAEAGISSRAPLLPGHGTTVADFARSRAADWAAAGERTYDEMCARYGRDQVFVVGFSMGGTVALDLAERRPVRGLVLMAPFLRVTRKWYYPMRPETVTRAACALGWPRVVKNLPVDIADVSLRPKLVYVGFTPLPTARSLFDYAGRVRADLPRVSCPVLVFHSPQDRVADFRESQRLLRVIASRDKRLVVLRRSKHLIPMDFDKEQVFAETLAFVRAHAPGSHKKTSEPR